MPVKAGSKAAPPQTAGGAETTPKKRKISQADSEKKGVGVSFEVYQSEAATFQGIGEYKKAINSYGRVWCSYLLNNNCMLIGSCNQVTHCVNFITGLLFVACY
jgi:hypothetical protein